MTKISTNQSESEQIAIVGMETYSSCYPSLAAFERSIYQGDCPHSQEQRLSAAKIREQFDCVVNRALADAAIASDGVKIIVSNSSQHQPSDADNLTEVDSVFQALAIAQNLLGSGVETVLVAGVDADLTVGAVVLQRYETAKQNHKRVYAILNNVYLSAVSAIPAKIAYLEVVADRRLEEIEIDAITSGNSHTCSCAVSSLSNAGYSAKAAEIFGLIKTALCLYYRYIPPVVRWQQPSDPKQWQTSPFYVAPTAQPWFTDAGVSRIAALVRLGDRHGSIVLSQASEQHQRDHGYLEQMPCYFFPLTAGNRSELLEQLHHLQQNIATGELSKVAQQTFADYQSDHAAEYAVVIVGKNRAELEREIERAIPGIAKAFDAGKDWHTPVGSYFTAHPQGKSKLAYVYPGAYNAHLGLGKDLFRLFPNLINDPVIQSSCNRVASLQQLLYPRSWKPFSRRELEAKERQLMADPLAMLESETGFAGLITTILRDYFQVQPQAAFGYSLGETSMMYAQGVWNDIERTSNVLHNSPLFKSRLAGKKEAVREYWQLSEPQSQDELWHTYVLIAKGEQPEAALRDRIKEFINHVREILQAESRVYLTQISTPKEVVIAGDPQSCKRVIERLGCDAFRAPFNHVIHCEAIVGEYDELIKLNTLPLRNIPNINFYSAANYQPIFLSDANPDAAEIIGHSLTQTLTQQLDFPRLVERVYQDDFRIFVEVGAGSNCSRWISEILKSKPHATVSLHRRGIDDFSCLIKALAKLVSHRLKLDLSPLYGQKQSAQALKPVDSLQQTSLNIPNSLSANQVNVNRFHHSESSKNESTPPAIDQINISQTHNSTSSSFKNIKKTNYFRIKNSLEQRKNINLHKSKEILANRDNQMILWQQNHNDLYKQEFQQNDFNFSKIHASLLAQESNQLNNTKTMILVQIKFLQQMIEQNTNFEL